MGIESDVEYLEEDVGELSLKLGRVLNRISLLERFGTNDFKYYVALDKALGLVCDAELQLELYDRVDSEYYVFQSRLCINEAVKVLEEQQ